MQANKAAPALIAGLTFYEKSDIIRRSQESNATLTEKK